MPGRADYGPRPVTEGPAVGGAATLLLQPKPSQCPSPRIHTLKGLIIGGLLYWIFA